MLLPGFQDGAGNGEGVGAAAIGSANFIAGEAAPLHEGEMGADRPVVFRGRRRDLDPRNAAGMDARAGIAIDGIGLVFPRWTPRVPMPVSSKRRSVRERFGFPRP
jgi:hypothetical protein